jgi:hypothetical protein
VKSDVGSEKEIYLTCVLFCRFRFGARERDWERERYISGCVNVLFACVFCVCLFHLLCVCVSAYLSNPVRVIS